MNNFIPHEKTITIPWWMDYREWPDQYVSGKLTTAQGTVHYPKDILWLNALINYSLFKWPDGKIHTEHLSKDES